MQITDINDDVRQWLAANLTLADRAGINESVEQLCESFDQTVRDYLEGPESRQEEAREVVAVYAVALGERLRTELGMQWVIIEDDYGTDLAIHRRAEDGNDVYSCPVPVVDKRLDADYRPGQLLEFHRWFLATAKEQLGIG